MQTKQITTELLAVVCRPAVDPGIMLAALGIVIGCVARTSNNPAASIALVDIAAQGVINGTLLDF